MTPMVLQERNGPAALLTLNRPQRHNSLVPLFLEEILAALHQAAADVEVRVVLLQANGRSFSTGGDVAGFYDHLDDIEPYARQIVGLLNQVILAIMRLPLPVIAAVQGIVTGGSLGLLLAADEVLVTPDASFTPYYSVVGFSPDGGWSVMLPQLIGARRAAGILMHNSTISAEQAVAWGLASRLVPPDQLRSQAMAAALDIAAKKRGSLSHTKQLLNGRFGDLETLLESERTHFVRQIVSSEARRGILNFLNKTDGNA